MAKLSEQLIVLVTAKEADQVRAAAEQESRTVSNLIRVILREHLDLEHNGGGEPADP